MIEATATIKDAAKRTDMTEAVIGTTLPDRNRNRGLDHGTMRHVIICPRRDLINMTEAQSKNHPKVLCHYNYPKCH